MTTNPQIERMAEAMSQWRNDKKLERTTWQVMTETVRNAYMEQAQAAYDASDARLVPMLVNAITKTLESNLYLADGDNCTLKRLKDALAQLPEEYRVS